MRPLAVFAVGGNSLVKDNAHQTMADQWEVIHETAMHIATMIERGWNVVVTYDNGPQLGYTLLRSELAKHVLHPVSLDVCGAEVQGALGYVIQ